MFQCLSLSQSSWPKRFKFQRRWRLMLAVAVGLGIVAPLVRPPAAEAACFFWQACARRRGQASNTRAGGKRSGRIVGGNDASVPYVISPRNAWIRNPNPSQPYTIRWNPVADAHRYTVRIWRWTFERDRPETALWETITVDDANELPFPVLVPLDPGNYYSIEVVTDTGVSSDLDEGYYESGFQLLFDEDYEDLRFQLDQLAIDSPDAALPLAAQQDVEDLALAQAGVFFLKEMYTDALDLLQVLADREIASDLVYTALGDTYSQSGLNQLAIESYGQALALAVQNTDSLSEAIICVSLADVYATLGLFEKTLQHLRQAREAYAQLDESTEVSRLDRRIEVISARLVRQR